ncbi:hypothetical protein BV25DRAFT_1463085 [Artomyces pyxidatus]|uniref:Uncharacterized protein n=1 Tax=Artomyces pyxidatus TaxID=48021 RepID=A0ACB8SKN6_9AGAM|nr:hypothetical protein BV25DRAFT_1463085 [Artomyces pyxidatus]
MTFPARFQVCDPMATTATQSPVGDAGVNEHPHTEIGAERPSSILIKSPDLWFQDRTIIIRTTSTSSAVPLTATYTLYKVHKFVLAHHCGAFSSLFHRVHDVLDNGSETHGGVPIMDLTDDAKDVDGFFAGSLRP